MRHQLLGCGCGGRGAGLPGGRLGGVELLLVPGRGRGRGQQAEQGRGGAAQVRGENAGPESRLLRFNTREGGARCPPRTQKRHCWPGLCPEAGPPRSLPLSAPRRVARVSRHVTVYVGPWSNCSDLVPPGQPQQARTVTRRAVSHVRQYQGPGPGHVSQLASELPPPAAVFHSAAPRVGQRTRDVLCRGEHGGAVAWSLCMDGTRATTVPADRQSCVLPRDCAVSEWGAWSAAGAEWCGGRGGSAGAGDTRARQILSLGAGAGRPCPHLTETRPRADPAPCRYRCWCWLLSCSQWRSMSFKALLK